MKFLEWQASVPQEIKGDVVWKVKAYQLALFLAELAWHDATKLLGDKRTLSLSDQLNRAAGAVSADIEEGYSRGTGKDRARFYQYGLGSAREARGWYYKGRHVLGPTVVEHRMKLLTEVIKLLLKMIPDQRGNELREDPVPYRTAADDDANFAAPDLAPLLCTVPMP
jgi:four helix bundle protein